MVPRRALLLAVTLLLSSCRGAPDHGAVPTDGPTTGHPPQTGAAAGISGIPVVTGSPVQLTGWEVTVYYTAVATLHTDKAAEVTGCPTIDCQKGSNQQELGSYPESFVKAVRDEGTGRTADGRYLNWSYDTGYWMDTAPRDTAGRPLRPWVSAAADSSMLKTGTRFTIVRCGTADSGGAIPAEVCAKLIAPTWMIVDEFTPGLGGSRHVDVYVGEETGPDFINSDLFTTLQGATLSVLRA